MLPVSCFGKLPFHREFLRIGLGGAGASWVVRWVEGAHESWNRAGNVPDGSPLVRFAAAVDGGAVVAGVVRQSTDGLRRHPVAFFVEDKRGADTDEWHLLPLAFEGPWAALGELGERSWESLASLTAALDSGVPEPDWERARPGYHEALAAPSGGAPWEALVGVHGEPARHVAANLLAVLAAQHDARSEAEGVSVAVPLPDDPTAAPGRACLWLELLGAAAARPAVVVGSAPSRLVAFFRPPEGSDLAAVLSSLDMAPIDDLGEPWQSLPPEGSDRAAAIDRLVTPTTGSLGSVREHLGSAVTA